MEHTIKRVRRTISTLLVFTLVILIFTPAVQADRTKAIREAVEYALKKFGKDVAEETAESLTARLTALVGKHGDDALEAFRKVGPRALRYVEGAGENGPRLVRLLARQGTDAAWLISQPASLKLFLHYGDEAAEVLIKHRGIAEGLIGRYESSAIQALKALDGQNARRLAILAEEGELARIGRTSELLAVMGRYGDRAADFIWRNKGALAVATALAAFLQDPEPFISGVRDITQAPLQEIARSTNWTLVILVLSAAILLLVKLRFGRPFFRGWPRRTTWSR